MKTIKVYQFETDSYAEFDILGKLKYLGESFGVDGLTDNKVYDCVDIDGGMLRIIDDSGEDYLYSAKNPKSNSDDIAGRWEAVEVYSDQLKEALDRYS